MHNRDEYPEIFAAKEKLEAELKPLMEKRKVHTDDIKANQLGIQKLKDKKSALNVLAMADAPRIGQLRSKIARMAKAMQAVSASDNS